MICQIITPDSSTVHEDVSAVSLPGIVGRFQVLPKHAELFQILIKGKMVIKKTGGIEETKEVTEGTCHFFGDTLTIIL